MKRIKETFRTVTFLALTVWMAGTWFISCEKTRPVSSHDRCEYFMKTLPGCQESQPFDDFRQWLMNDPNSTAYLSELKTEGIISNIAFSRDDRINEIHWSDNQGVYHNLVQVHTEEGFRAWPGTLLDYDTEEPRPTEVITQDIESFVSGLDTFYVALSMNGEYSPLYGNPIFEVSVYHVYGDTLYRMENFFHGQHADPTGSFLRFTYNPVDWRIRNVLHGLNGFSIDWVHNQILIPVIDEEERATDLYHLYMFSIPFNCCYQNTIVHSPEIGPALTGYRSLEQHYVADSLYVRIDLMMDGTYRYASWHEHYQPNRFVEQYFTPDIIIEGGTFDGQTYTFHNGSYTYRVPAVNDCYSTDAGMPVKPNIIVEHKGRVVDSFNIDSPPY